MLFGLDSVRLYFRTIYDINKELVKTTFTLEKRFSDSQFVHFDLILAH